MPKQTPKLIINTETLDRLRDGQPWGVFAERIGVDSGTLSRIRNGKSQPGPTFLASILTALPVRFEDVVTVSAD